jgi:hypothetical protein
MRERRREKKKKRYRGERGRMKVQYDTNPFRHKQFLDLSQGNGLSKKVRVYEKANQILNCFGIEIILENEALFVTSKYFIS